MDWPGIYHFLSRELDALSPHVTTLRASNQFPVEELFRAEIIERDAIDAACQTFSRQRSWPNLTQIQALLSYIRLGQAALFAEVLAYAGEPAIFPPDYPD